MKKSISLVLSGFLIFGFIGCSGDTSSSSENLNTGGDSNNGYYLDNAVEGVHFECGSKSGNTNKDGRFYFDDNSGCTFSVAGIQLRQVTADDLSKGVKIYEDNVQTARFLQSFDYDGIIGNGIELKDNVIAYLEKKGIGTVPDSDLEIQALLDAIKTEDVLFKGKLVTTLNAQAHINMTKLTTADGQNEVLESLEALLFKLSLRVNVSNTFKWDADLEINKLSSALADMNEKIEQAAIELADEDLTASQQKEVDDILSYRDRLSTLISELKMKNETLIENVKRVENVDKVNAIIDDIDKTTQSDVRQYFEKLGAKYMVSMPGIYASDEERYIYMAAEIAHGINEDFSELHIRMDLLKNAYAIMFDKLHKAYMAEHSNGSGSNEIVGACTLEKYSNVDLGGEVNLQCQYAYFLECEKEAYQDQATKLDESRKVVCSMLDSYELYGGSSSAECNYCTKLPETNTTSESNTTGNAISAIPLDPINQTLSYPGKYPGMVVNMLASAALKDDGSVVTWGDSTYGGDSSGVIEEISSGVKAIYSAGFEFAALKEDGSVTAWGSFDGGTEIYSVANRLINGVKTIYSTNGAFAVLKDDGSVITWGRDGEGGNSINVKDTISSGVVTIYSTRWAFAALKDDGSVVTWGSSSNGGDSSSISNKLNSGVKTIYSTQTAFAALKDDGSVVTWGYGSSGGDSSSVTNKLNDGVKTIYSTQTAFAALKDDGSVVTWGFGGDSSSVENKLSRGVKVVYTSQIGFAALKEDGSVVTWGFSGDTRSVADQLSSGVEAIYSAGQSAFAALKVDGSVVTWGDSEYGGDSSAVADKLSGGVKTIYSTDKAFAALKSNDSVITWGDSVHGGDSSTVAGQISSGVKTIYSTQTAFAALKDDGSVVTWGHPLRGGDSSSVANKLSSGVVTISKSYGGITGDSVDLSGSNSVDSTLPTTSQPILHNGIEYKTVVSPFTNRIWLDRNLGASEVCISSNDNACYGDYYQWGRNTDGHERMNSATTTNLATDYLNAGSDFITNSIAPYDWTAQDSDGTLRQAEWNKTDGTSVCPVGFRVPTLQELKAEIIEASVKVNNTTDAFENFLKIPAAGQRSRDDGSMYGVGISGELWTTGIRSYDNNHVFSDNMYIYEDDAGASLGNGFTNAYNIRCVKD